MLVVRPGRREDAREVLALWDIARSEHAVTSDRAVDVERLLDAGEAYLRGLGARRVTALVAHDDSVAAAFWDAAGYPVDREIGRRVRNL